MVQQSITSGQRGNAAALQVRLIFIMGGAEAQMPHERETSHLIRVTAPTSPVDYWLWRLAPQAEAKQSDPERLETEGWQRVGAPRLTFLLGQLIPVRLLQLPDGATEAFAPLEEMGAGVPNVALVFTLPETMRRAMSALFSTEDMPDVLPLLINLPPPQVGEAALVASSTGWQCYRIEQLDEEAQARWRAIGDHLRALAEPADWWLYTSLLAKELEQPEACAEERARLAALWEQTRGKAKRRAIEEQRQGLLTAHDQAEKLRTLHRRMDQEAEEWLGLWGTVRQLVRQLARDYGAVAERDTSALVAAHTLLPIIASPSPLPATSPVSEPPSVPQKRTRGKHRPRPELVAKNQPAVMIRTDAVTREIMRALLHGAEYQRLAEERIAVYRTPLAKGRGELTITISPGVVSQAWDDVIRSLDVLGDEVVDTFCAFLALALDQVGSQRLTDAFYISPDDILHICQRKQSNGSYLPQQRATIVDHLHILSRAHVLATWPGSRADQMYRAESAILDFLSSAIGEYKIATGQVIWERRAVKMGDWIKMVPPLTTQTAMMLRQILKYHPQRQRFPKRLGRYLTMQKLQGDGAITRKLGVLLAQAGIQPDLEHPGDTLKSFKEALETLQQHGVIVEAHPVVESLPPGAYQQIGEHASGWWEFAALQEWRIVVSKPSLPKLLLSKESSE